MTTWIDFKALKQQLKILDVLNAHNVKLKIRGEQASAFCPLPDHADSKSPSFSAHLGRNCFNCFGCQRHGSAIDLELLLRGLDPADTKAVRKVALELVERHGLTLGRSDKEGRARKTSRTLPPKCQRRDQHSAMIETPARTEQQLEDAADDDRVVPNMLVNLPLGFVLQHLNPVHPYLIGRGFTSTTIEHFGLGFCGKGMLKDRIAIPLHDSAGHLIGYAGRTVDDRAISAEHPKYLFPGRREKAGQTIEFRKSRLLYNAHRIATPAASLVIVEGFTSVWWLWQNGFPSVVALMGSSPSEWQVLQIAALTDVQSRLLVFTDGDEAGVRLARELTPQLAARRWTKWIKLLSDEQPTDIDQASLQQLLST